jgi:hypothetical protein
MRQHMQVGAALGGGEHPLKWLSSMVVEGRCISGVGKRNVIDMTFKLQIKERRKKSIKTIITIIKKEKEKKKERNTKNEERDQIKEGGKGGGWRNVIYTEDGDKRHIYLLCGWHSRRRWIFS